jgi:hypothetical protein
MTKRKMYSVTYDKEQALKIMQYVNHNPQSNRKQIAKDCITNFYRLKYLEQEGLVHLPKPLPYGERNGLSRKNN